MTLSLSHRPILGLLKRKSHVPYYDFSCQDQQPRQLLFVYADVFLKGKY
jgi:hypothetical protein